MAQTGEPDPVLSYATPASAPTRQSRYAVASLVVSVGCAAWLTLELLGVTLPFDDLKQHRIGTVAAVFAMILAIAAYSQPHRRRLLAHVAITVAGLLLLAYIAATPL